MTTMALLTKNVQTLNRLFSNSQIRKRTVYTVSSLLHKKDDSHNTNEMDTKTLKMLEQRSSSLSHFREDASSTSEHTLPHPIWSESEAEQVTVTHRQPKGISDHLAYYAVSLMRSGFDLISGYSIKNRFGTLTERDFLLRCIFLETVAGVPGMAAGAGRHFQSLRLMKRDNGWIHTLLEEAENERMHLMTFMELWKPGMLFRVGVISTQFIFTVFFCGAYVIRPALCHRFVGYLEEQAVITYSHILNEIDSGRLPSWSKLAAPETAIEYWKLPPTATMRDVILVVRADEAHHRLVNHTLGSLNLKAENPFKPGE